MSSFYTLLNHINQSGLYPAFVVMGSTASGKTKLATALSRLIEGSKIFTEAPILSMDSRQVYKGLDIGTGKDLFEYNKLKYYLIDIWTPLYKGNVNEFHLAASKILKKKSAYILSGGSAFYIKNIFFPQDFTKDKSDMKFTSRLETFYSKEKLRAILKNRSLHNYKLTDTSSKRRIARSIELSRKGILIQEFQYSLPNYLKLYIPIFIHLELPRQDLKHNIKLRLKERIQSGMIEESKNLLKNDLLDLERMKKLGLEYKWIALHLENKISLEEMEIKLCKDISRMAKVQRFEKQPVIARLRAARTGSQAQKTSEAISQSA